MEIVFVFILKMIDNCFATAKTIFISKEKYLLGSLFNAVATYFYMSVVVQLTKHNDSKTILAICIATFLGTYIPGLLVKKSERDKLYIFNITASSIIEGKLFADEIRKLGLAINTYTTYDNEMSKTLACKIYCDTRVESELVKDLLKKKKGFNFNVCVPIE